MADSESIPISTRARGGVLLPGLLNPSRSRNRFQLFNARRNISNEMANSNPNVDDINIDQMRGEIIRLRQQTEMQRYELDRLRDRERNVNEPQGVSCARLVNALIEGLQSIQIESKPPKFENESRNPIEFIQSFV